MVVQAMAKWPNVPHCYGWLGLAARGNWYMRDDRAQAAGAFQSGLPHSKGSLLKHEKLIDFIQRNYACDALGQWFFQNGPQRVYVELEATPWIWRLDVEALGSISVRSHAGHKAAVQACWLDEQGRVYLSTDVGFGLVHTQDVGVVATAVEMGIWTPKAVEASKIGVQFSFEKCPRSKNTQDNH